MPIVQLPLSSDSRVQSASFCFAFHSLFSSEYTFQFWSNLRTLKHGTQRSTEECPKAPQCEHFGCCTGSITITVWASHKFLQMRTCFYLWWRGQHREVYFNFDTPIFVMCFISFNVIFGFIHSITFFKRQAMIHDM